jgi:mannosyl-oligosaccharide alpha-1,2-mannosidase
MTLIDSLDTLWLMNMKDEFYEARDWVKNSLNLNKDKYVSVFETTIRALGGLLAAYDWSHDEVFLEKANDLGERLFKAFSTNTQIAYGEVNLQTGHGKNEQWLRNEVSLSAATTLQVEFRYLAKVIGKPEFAKTVDKAFESLNRLSPKNGLYPATIVNIGTVALGRMEPKISFGSRADSFYEYMLKIWLQGNRKEDMYREMYDKSIEGMHRLLLKQDQHSGLWYIGQTTKKIFSKSMDHLVCFMGGLLALGAYTDPNGLQSERAQRDLKTAKAFTYSCYQMYAATATGLSPEIVESWYKNPRPDRGSSHYILRPEAVESFFILYQLTGDPVYREWGWEVFQAIEKYCKTAIAYASHPDVTDVNAQLNDSMESFFLGETLKYLYLLFDPDTEIDVLEKVRSLQHTIIFTSKTTFLNASTQTLHAAHLQYRSSSFTYF